MLETVESVALPCDLTSFDEIIDVRSPSEFNDDHLPGALNLPVLDDQERSEVGTLHRKNPFEARRLGAALISGHASEYIRQNLSDRPKGWAPLLYCWRGGMRSRSLAYILRSIGWRARVLEGGYKAWRHFVREDLEQILQHPGIDLHILNGLTGSAKTRLLHTLQRQGAQVLDLEGLANHRGSLLGQVGPQPSQKRFESLLHAQLKSFDLAEPIFTEGESNRIGTVHLPQSYWARLPDATTYEVDLSLDERTRYLLEDYEHFPKAGAHLSQLLDELRRIRGSKQVNEWQQMIRQNEWPSFVRSILKNHYDLAYRRPGQEGCVYPPPKKVISLANADPGTLEATARQLLTELSLP